MPQQSIQPSVAGGELDPRLWFRPDLSKWHIGVKTMQNWYVHPSGGASNRAGTAWVGEVLDSTKLGRLIPFQFNTTQTYVLEFGDLKMRLIANGSYVTEAGKNITGATKANPCQLTIVGHGFSTGDRIYVSGVVGMTQLNSRYFTVTSTGANTVTIGIDSTGYSTYTSGGSAARVYTVTSPYALADLSTLKYEQSADTMTLTHRSYAPYKLVRAGATSWSFSAITFAPSTVAPTNLATASSGSTYYAVVTAINDTTGEESLPCDPVGSSSNTASWTWTAVSGCSTYNFYRKRGSIYGFIAQSTTNSFTDTGDVADIQTTPPQQRNPFGAGPVTGVTITSGGSGYSSPTGKLYDGSTLITTVSFTVSAGAITAGTLASTGARVSQNAYITITDGAGSGAILQPQWTDDGSGNGTSYISGVTVVNGGSGYHSGVQVHSYYAGIVDYGGYRFTATVAAGVITAVSVTVGSGAWDGTAQAMLTIGATDSTGTGAVVVPTVGNDGTGNPSVNAYHDGRQWFMATGSQPQTMWGSVAAAFNNMSVSTPTRDSDAITRTLASRQVNTIKHAISMANGMIVFTSGAEWKISAGSADVITPSQFVARPQSYNGSSDLRPLVVNDTLLYIPANAKRLRSLQYQWAQDTWTGTDMSLLGAHLFRSNTMVDDPAYCRDPDSIIWVPRDDGTLLGFTFLSEQQLYAWHRHTTTNGTFERVCAVQEGDETALYCIVKRTINGATKRYVERLHTRVFATIADAWFLDCALQYSGAATTTINGLWHLINEQVYALADGVPVGPYTVNASGQITLGSAASKVTVGKIIPNPDIETLSADGQDQAGTYQGRKKKVNHVTIALENSANTGLKAGPSGNQASPTLYQIKPKDIVNPLATAPSSNPSLITDVMHMVSAPSWDWYGTTLIRATQPLPYTITGIMYDFTAGS